MPNESKTIEVEEIYHGTMLNNPIGFCSSGKWRGWIFAKHPDGQWVSIAKIGYPIPEQKCHKEKNVAA
jgi:hypothetical protein